MKKIEEKITKIQDDTLNHYRGSVTRKRYNEDVERIKEVYRGSVPSDTDFVLIRRLAAVYHPEKRGIVNGEEAALIIDYLEIAKRTVLSLRNLRNSVVMLSDFLGDDGDRVSAITHIIDGELLDRGVEI